MKGILAQFVLLAAFVGIISAHVCVHDIVTRGLSPKVQRISPLRMLKKRLLPGGPVLWRPLKIHFDYSGIEALPKQAKEFLMNDLVPRAGNLLSSFAQVKYTPNEKWAVSSQICHKATVPARYRTPVNDVDLIIFVTFLNEPAASYRAWASACELKWGSNRPIVGQINFNWKTLSESMQTKEFKPIFHTTVHELTHVLGFSKSFYNRYVDENEKPIPSNRVIKDVYSRGYPTSVIILPKVRDFVRSYFNCPTAEGAELENQGDEGSLGSHWERRVFTNDYMTAASRYDQKISNLTLHLLDSTGWYKIDYSVAGELTFGKNEGCNFLNLPCYMNGKPRYGGWCPNATEKTEGCDAKHTAISSCELKPAGSFYDDSNKSKALPSAFDYFKGGLAHDHFNDNCPYYRPYSNGACNNPDNQPKNYDWIYDQYYGVGSRCFEGNYFKNTARFNGYPNLPNHGTCHQYRCIQDSLGRSQVVVILGTVQVVCPAQGGPTAIPGYTGLMKCPAGDDFCRNEKVNNCPNKNYCSDIGHCYRGKCICPPGFEGDTCEVPILDCRTNKCNGRGVCTKNVCACQDGWGGAQCEKPRATVQCAMCRAGAGICYGGKCLDSLTHFSQAMNEGQIPVPTDI